MEEYKDIEHRIFLIKAYLEDNLSPEETGELEKWLENSESRRELLQRVRDKKNLSGKLDFYSRIDPGRDWNAILKRTRKGSHKVLYRRISAYAAVFAGLFLMTWAYIKLTPDLKEDVKTLAVADSICPGSRFAYIELVNGEKITLGDSANRLERDVEGVVLKEEQEGLVVSNNNLLNVNLQNPEYNRIVVPRGGEYQMTLPDGTKVWLNSDSRLEFPSVFPGNERKVRLTGEAFFQVQHDKAKPFHVEVNTMEVVVLGTSFNINAYEESMRTTLVNGAVEVKVEGASYRLSPGYEANVSHGKVMIGKADVYGQTAWKDGKFVFREKRLEEVMLILGRWYDINIFYQNPAVKTLHFTGNIPRHSSIGEVLKFLEYTNLVRFNITGRTVIVSD